MARDRLSSSNQLRQQVTICGFAAALATLVIVSLYVYLLSDLEAADWSTLGFGMGLVGLLSGGASVLWLRRAVQPIVNWLDADANDELAAPQTLNAFKTVIALPSDSQRMFTITWICAAIGVPVVLTIMDAGGWGGGIRSFVAVMGGVTAAMVSGLVLFFGVKGALEPIRIEMATRIQDPDERRSRIRHLSISSKMSSVVVGSVAAAVVFAMTLGYVQSEAALSEFALKWQVKALDAVVQKLDGSSFDEAVRAVVSNRDLLPYPIHFEMIEAETAGVGSDESRQMRHEILASVQRGKASGTLSKTHQASLWVYRALSDGRVVAAKIERSDVHPRASSSLPVLGFVLIASMGCAFMIATLISSDLRRSIASLRAAAETMAGGDLQRGRVYESEDELGDLWRSFEVMGNALRSTVRSLSDAADRVDSRAGEIASVADEVAAASADQARRIQQASELMVSINSQVMEVAGSAQDLNVSVEESGSSILELGATGDELNETASVLGAKVDEVSSSIEQMMRSVKQVGSSSDGLASAAAETSASMEEMASAMRAVDTTAELTASLSRDVVASAESGQQKVSQTIDGMRAIRDATDTAEGVIRGLGARTKEIGAILDVIDDVAEETNLLALNAAIIAAQAGEHGRAFSVVAGEIKELADRVLASTKEIGSLIRAVQEESDNAVGAIEVGSQSVASGVELSAEAGRSLEEITRSSRESGQRIAEIVSAVREQTTAASHVVSLMDTVRDGVTAIAGAAADQDRGNEVVYRSSITMREVAQQVRRTTEEQSRGFGRIRESVEGVREVVENINGSLREQSTACSQVAESLEQVFERARSNEEAAKSMGDSVRDLVSQAEALREQVVKFRI